MKVKATNVILLPKWFEKYTIPQVASYWFNKGFVLGNTKKGNIQLNELVNEQVASASVLPSFLEPKVQS